MLRHKIDIPAAIKAAGYTTTQIKRENLIGQQTYQNIRNKGKISWDTLDTLCTMLNCQPGDLIEYIPNKATEQEKEEPQD